MARVPVAGQHRIEVTAEDGSVAEVVVRLRYKRVHILPPIGKHRRYPALDLTVIHAGEATQPRGHDRVDWKLATDLAVSSPEEAVETLRWYAQRRKLEFFHKVLKSGCRVEIARLRTAERLTKLIAVFGILGWRIFWTTMLNRAAPAAPPRAALTEAEITSTTKRCATGPPSLARRPCPTTSPRSPASAAISPARVTRHPATP
jgi:hypothetical protein